MRNGKSWTTAAVLAALVGSTTAVNADNVQATERANRNARLAADPAQQFDPGSVIVKFKADSGEPARGAARARANGAVRRQFTLVPGLEHLSVGDVNAALAVLRADPTVEYAEPDFVVHTSATPNDSSYSSQWGLNNTGQLSGSVVGIDIDAPEAWNTFTGDPNLVVAVIDDGTDWAHPDLAANMWSNAGEIAGNGQDDDGNGYVDDVRGWDFFSNDNDPESAGFHGTHTAGTIGAAGNNGTGGRDHRGGREQRDRGDGRGLAVQDHAPALHRARRRLHLGCN
jgi:subtilisin family serine protease